MIDPWAWAIVLLVLGLGLAVLEIFFPSGGILGFLTIASIVAAIILAFRSGPVAGMLILGSALIGLPVAIGVALKYWPNTSIGRRVIISVPETDEVLPTNPQRERLKALVGKIGKARSKMVPSGAIIVDGRTVDAVSEGSYIDVGQDVRVIEVRGNRVVVRLLEPDETPEPAPDSDDPLSRPIDSIADDPFEEENA